MLISLGRIVGCAAFSLVAVQVKTVPLTMASVVASAVMLALFAVSVGNLVPAFIAAAFLGFTLTGAVAGLYAIVPVQYPPSTRATAIALVIGVGRIGSIVAPLVVGALVDGGWQGSDLYLLFTVGTTAVPTGRSA